MKFQKDFNDGVPCTAIGCVHFDASAAGVKISNCGASHYRDECSDYRPNKILDRLAEAREYHDKKGSVA